MVGAAKKRGVTPLFSYSDTLLHMNNTFSKRVIVVTCLAL